MSAKKELRIVIYRLTNAGDHLTNLIHREFLGHEHSVYIEDNTIYVKRGSRCIGKYSMNYFSFSFDEEE